MVGCLVVVSHLLIAVVDGIVGESFFLWLGALSVVTPVFLMSYSFLLLDRCFKGVDGGSDTPVVLVLPSYSSYLERRRSLLFS